MSSQTQLNQTALSFIEGYNLWSIDAILAPRAPNCTQRVYPLRLGRPPRNNTDYRDYFTSLLKHFHGFNVTILDIVEDLPQHKVVIHARSEAQTVIGPYGNEYMIMLRMTEDDKQIQEVKEFVDSGYSQEFFERLRDYADGQGKGEEKERDRA